MELQEAIARFKELNLSRVVLDFNCGGDSMGDTTWRLIKDVDGEEVEVNDDELESYFDDEVYRKVDFYVNSVGHYNSEAGTVTVTIEDDKDDEGEYFSYYKDAQSEYSEQCVNSLMVKLTPEMAAFISENVSNINGGDSGFTINYKHDFILTDEQETLVDEIEALINKECEEYEPELEDEDGTLDGWFNYTTNSEDDEDEFKELTITDGALLVRITNSYTTYVES